MRVERLQLHTFRSYPELELTLPAGLCVVTGPNGVGKTNLLEAVGYVCGLESFRGVPTEAMVRRGEPRAVVRAELRCGAREVLVEAELRAGGRGRVMLNRSRVQRRADLLELVAVSVFSPDDLALIKGGPAERRAWLDHTVVGLSPRADLVRSDVDRALRQRNALLKRLAGRTPATEDLITLDVWDGKLAAAADELGRRRAATVDALAPAITRAYERVAGRPTEVSVRYEAPWREHGLAEVLARGRAEDLRRGVTLAGPHRDEVGLGLHGLPARTHASQGEQRSLALALRLAAHLAVTEARGEAPVLLLDDVFSELDPQRSRALVEALPEGQVLLSSAAGHPEGVRPELVVHVEAGRVRLDPA